MGKVLNLLLVTTLLFSCLTGTTQATASNHYPNGIEGLKASSLPPPGEYLRVYNFLYSASRMNDGDGTEAPVDLDLTAYAFVPRFIWVSNYKILGADYVMDVIVPIHYTKLKIGAMSIDDSKFALGDVAVEPLILTWHRPRYDLAWGVGAFIPIGSTDETNAAAPGKNLWTILGTLGGTFFFDPAKNWSISALGRYEIHTENSDTKVTPGNDFHFEWGLCRTLPGKNIWDVGVAGYVQMQVTDDDGDGVVYDAGVHDRVFATGPEVAVFMPASKLIIQARGLVEYGARDRSQGIVVSLGVTRFLF